MLGLAACGGGSGDSPHPPIVLISIDTLRSDRLPIYGFAGVETPAIDGLRRDAVLFERAYSPMPTTLPSHATMLTGLNPPGHGIRLNMGYALGESTPYLPEILARRGYRTGAAVSGFVIRAETGLGRGFEVYEDSIESDLEDGRRAQRAGMETLAAIRPWLREVAAEPFFLFFHLYEPHAPFEPPEPFRSRYASPYLGEVAAADAVVGALLAELRDLGVYESALVVLTADHGEGLGDHGEYEHGILLYRESLQVPLLIKLPGNQRAGASVAAPAHLADLTPTVLDLLGETRPEPVDGVSLLSLEGRGAPERKLYAEAYYPRVYFGWSEMFSLVDERFHYIHSPEPELFDLVDDPAERRNLIDERRDVVAEFRRALSEVDTSFDEPGDVDIATRLRLASLGYLGMALDPPEGDLPAARSQVHLLEELKRAIDLAAGGRHAEAAAAYRGIVEENPNVLVAWPGLARSLARSGRYDEALAAYDRALEKSARTPAEAAEAARLAVRLGDLDRAERYAAVAAQVDPPEAHRLQAQIALARRDTAKAREHAEAAIAIEPEDEISLLTMAQIERLDRAPQRALDLLERAESLRGGEPLQNLNLLKGNLLDDLGRTEEAERALRREMTLYPRDPRAYAQLALLLAKAGRGAEVPAVMRRLVDADGSEGAYAVAVRTLQVLGSREAAGRLLAEGRSRYPRSAPLRGLAGG